MTVPAMQVPVTHLVAVLAHGHVLAVEVTSIDYQVGIWYKSAITIRRWGTTQGLGQLYQGPREASVLDPVNAPGYIPMTAVIHFFLVTGWDDAFEKYHTYDPTAG